MANSADARSRRSDQFPTAAALGLSQSVPEVRQRIFGRNLDTALFLGLIGYAALIVTWALVRTVRGQSGGVFPTMAPHLLTVAAIVLAFRAANERTLDHGGRRFWRAVGASPLVFVFADALLLATRGASAPFSAAAPFISQWLILLALLQLPSVPRSKTDRAKLALDVTTVFVGGLLVVWFDRFYAATGARIIAPLPLLLAHATVIGDLVLILIASVLWRRTALQHRANVLVIVSVALLLHFVASVADVVFMMTTGRGRGWVAIATPLYTLLLALAAWLKCATVSHRHVRVYAVASFGNTRSSLIPYAAIVPAFGLLITAALDQTAQPLSGLAVGAAILTSLAFARQRLSTRETIRDLKVSTARNNEARFQALIQHSSDVITIVDRDGTMRYVSPSISTVLGHDAATLTNSSLASLLHPDDVALAMTFLSDLSLSTDVTEGTLVGARKCEWRIAHANGSWMTVDNVGTNLLDEPVVGGLVLNTRDVTEQAVIKSQYMHQAFHDPLTDLANRSLFLYEVEHALARSQRPGLPVTVLFLDLDNFKTVNDSLGHAEGDRMLIESAKRLSNCVRETDVIARLGGDEFAVLVEQTDTERDVLEIADRIADALSRPFMLRGKQVFVNASIGIARNVPGGTTDDLVRNADLAMYVAKTRGKGQYVLFEPSMHAAALDRLVMEADLRKAIEREELYLEYQPIVILETGEIVGAEALVRWCCRERGMVPPGVFIPIAEATGLITAIGRWVLRKACRTAKQWERERGASMRITVNLSGRQLQEPGVVDDVRNALAESELDASHLVLELTESMLMQNTDLSMTRLMALKALGVSLAIDDFGTGYSSLSYLQRYPIDILKIDKAFVDVIDKGGEGPVLASAIVALGETLRLRTVAEGIERDSQRTQLMALGCTLGQGYLFAKPLHAEDFWAILQIRGAQSYEATERPRVHGEQAA